MLIYSLTLQILDFTHNSMSKIISGHTIMSGISEKSIVDTKICLYCILNYINFIFDLGRNGGHFWIFMFYVNTLSTQIQEGS